MRSFRPAQRRQPTSPRSSADIVRAARDAAQQRAAGYRERSLALYGWICARCAREFEANTLHLLTVHHRDGNHNYNPPDGSNWENLCVYCHEAEHSKNLLADYIDEARRKK